MKKNNFGFLLFDGVEDMDFAGPWEMISCWHKDHHGPQQIITIHETSKPIKTIHGLTIQAEYDFANCPPLDFLLIPGAEGIFNAIQNPNVISFIQAQARHCAFLLSVCTGVFLLDAANLLHGKKVTTHWAYIEKLKTRSYLHVVQNRYVHDGNIWTSAGISAGIDLTLAFISYIDGPEVAGKIQQQTEYYPEQKIYPQDRPLPPYVHYP